MDEDRCPECGKSKINLLYCNNCGIFFNQSSEVQAVEEGLSEEAQRLLGYPECDVRGSDTRTKKK